MKNLYKLAGTMVIVVLIGFSMTSCPDTFQTEQYAYRVVGWFSGWGDSPGYDEQYMMTLVAKSDPRLSPISTELANAKYVYLYEHTPDLVDTGSGVGYGEPGVDHRFALKIIRLIRDSEDPSGWAHDTWIPSPEAGGVSNLSPSTMQIPANRSPEAAEEANDGLGSVGNDLALLGGDGTYYIVFAIMNDGSRAVGAIKQYAYRVTGQFSEWNSDYDQQYTMTIVAKSDPRLTAIHTELGNAKYVYLYEHTPDLDEAGWDVGYGEQVDGRFAMKIIRLNRDSGEPSGWAHDTWIPSPEAGGVSNLSPNTMQTPLTRSQEEAEEAGDGLGWVNDDLVLISGDGTYYIVFAIMNDDSRAVGAVKKL